MDNEKELLEKKLAEANEKLNGVNPFTGCKCKLYEEYARKCLDTRIENVEHQLALAVEALTDWLAWEDEQIKKDGAYVRPEINELIKKGKDALTKISGQSIWSNKTTEQIQESIDRSEE